MKNVLRSIFVITDSGRLPCSDYSYLDMQTSYYEGYTGELEVTNLFVINFFGGIIHAAVHISGS